MESRHLRRTFAAAMRAEGFVYHAPTWHLSTDELIWAVELDHSPFGPVYDVDIGIWVRAFDPTLSWRPWPIGSKAGDGRLPRVGDCPFSISYAQMSSLESLRPKDATSDPRFSDHKSYFAMLMDFKRGAVPSDERYEAVQTLAHRLAGLARDIPTLDALRRRFADGMFRAAYVHRDIRPLLESMSAF